MDELIVATIIKMSFNMLGSRKKPASKSRDKRRQSKGVFLWPKVTFIS